MAAATAANGPSAGYSEGPRRTDLRTGLDSCLSLVELFVITPISQATLDNKGTT